MKTLQCGLDIVETAGLLSTKSKIGRYCGWLSALRCALDTGTELEFLALVFRPSTDDIWIMAWTVVYIHLVV